MLLEETVEELYQTPLFAHDGTAWTLQPQKCALAAYDRFISDRAFGQKKRVLLTPGNQPLDTIDKYYRVGTANSEGTFIIESQNEDLNEFGSYLNVYMLREVQSPLRVLAWDETAKNAAGVPIRQRRIISDWHWCDLERYGAANSTEVMVTFSTYTLTTSRNVELPEDCRLEVDLGYRVLQFRIIERFDLMNSIQLRLGEWDGRS